MLVAHGRLYTKDRMIHWRMSVNPDFEPSPRSLARRCLLLNRDNKKQNVSQSGTSPRMNLQLEVKEPGLKNDGPSLDTILVNYLDTFTQRVNFHFGYPVNICYDHHATSAPLLQFHLNNCGDPFLQNTVDFYSKDFEVAVLNWFAQFWEIEKDQYVMEWKKLEREIKERMNDNSLY
ncbi:hypothetical protein H5410_042524 [Solanum commersonii]|uniref:Uncharacterized protein n=1 Tax=Solanum commersonii TaxID=4109 RepID=A0A9J5XW96_SOLCO|nr:hypothetical protein H5410_042524 [Solanum commersonii]